MANLPRNRDERLEGILAITPANVGHLLRCYMLRSATTWLVVLRSM